MNIGTIKFLNQLKNASIKNELQTTVVSNDLTQNLIKLLYREGLIQSFKIRRIEGLNKTNSKEATILLRYRHEKATFSNLTIISTPAIQRYLSLNVIDRISSKNVVFVFSTSRGLLTLEKCKRYRIGGVLLFTC